MNVVLPRSQAALESEAGLPTPAFETVEPAVARQPLILSSPHSGTHYTADFLAASRLPLRDLRRSEDSFVDELFGDAPALGATMLRALFPRAWLDVNREPYELDPAMFDDPLPAHANTRTPRVSAGLGVIARIVREGAEIYPGKLAFAEAERRIDTLHRPYHAALTRLIERDREHFGYAVLVDCHSMPSNAAEAVFTGRCADIVLGDRYGASCGSSLTDAAQDILTDLGFSVVRNNPYAGGYTVEHHGRPSRGVHALQVELRRNLYMDEERIEKLAAFDEVKAKLRLFAERLIARDWSRLQPTIMRLTRRSA